MSKKSLFQSVKSFINSRKVGSTFTTKELHDKMLGIESVTFWKSHGAQNKFYRTDTYRSYLRRIGFVKKIKNGLWEIIAPIPFWFDSGTVNFLLFPTYKFENEKWTRQSEYRGETKSQIELKLEWHFKYYKEKLETPIKNKFKIGDKVKIISNNNRSDYNIGDIGVITEIISFNCYKVFCDIDPTAIAAYHCTTDLELCDEQKYKVGDYVEIIDNLTNHNFEIGEIVKVAILDCNNKISICESISKKLDSGEFDNRYIVDEKEVTSISKTRLQDLEEAPKSCELKEVSKIESNPKELAKELVGDGKTPNLWFVTSSQHVLILTNGEGGFELLDNADPEDSETFGPFYSYESACKQYDDINLDPYDNIGHVFIEDRLNGIVKEKYAEKIITIDYNFNEHDDSKLFYKK